MNYRIAAAWIWTALILAGTLSPADWLPAPERKLAGSGWLPLDKLAHMALFAGYGFLWAWARSPTGRTAPILVGGLLLAALTEAGQALPFLKRDADVLDAMADALGLFFGLGGFRILETVARSRAARLGARPEASALSVEEP